MPIELKMPALSPTMEEGTLAKWLVKEGDKVESGDILAEIETDKATMEFEAVDEGTVAKILVPEGTDGVKVGAPIALIAAEGESVDAAAAALDASGELKWRQMAQDAFAWFFGNNDAGMPMADASDGSCCDGLMATGINRNQGAESILSLHLAAQTVREIFNDRKQSGQERERDAEARSIAAS